MAVVARSVNGECFLGIYAGNTIVYRCTHKDLGGQNLVSHLCPYLEQGVYIIKYAPNQASNCPLSASRPRSVIVNVSFLNEVP